MSLRGSTLTLLDDASHHHRCLRGLALRYALVLLVHDGGARRVDDLVSVFRAEGFRLGGRPSKEISAALRWEVRRGRAVLAPV